MRVRLVIDPRPTPPILGFSGQLTQVFSNLVRNASEAAPSGSTVVIRIRSVDRKGRAEARVTIHDRGQGIPRAVQKKIFDPFFTTKELKGSGLGLWVSRSLIARHRGSIRFRTSERSGTTFAVFLPVVEERSSGSVAEQSQRELLEA
jgi:signal transduction histidine kinase